jgi:transcriptional regulator with XRE-family HTH domain
VRKAGLNNSAMKKLINIRDIYQIEELKSEYDLEKASLLTRKLRWMSKEDSSLIPVREKLLQLMEDYENKHWKNEELITDQQVEESDNAEEIIQREIEFYNKRKEILRAKLKEYDMNQQELGELLGHSKSYISELVNGVSNFSMKDIIVIHRIFKISFDDLIPTFIESETREELKQNIHKLNKPKLKLSKEDLYV